MRKSFQEWTSQMNCGPRNNLVEGFALVQSYYSSLKVFFYALEIVSPVILSRKMLARERKRCKRSVEGL